MHKEVPSSTRKDQLSDAREAPLPWEHQPLPEAREECIAELLLLHHLDLRSPLLYRQLPEAAEAQLRARVAGLNDADLARALRDRRAWLRRQGEALRPRGLPRP